MWSEKLSNGKTKFFERYKDPYTDKWKRVSITLDSGSARAKKEAQKQLDVKIEKRLEQLKTSDILFSTAFSEWFNYYKDTIKKSSYHSVLASIERINNDFAVDVKLNRITPKYIQDYFNSQDSLTYHQKYRIKTTLNMFFDYATTLELIESNPARKIKLVKPKRTLEDIENINNKYLEHDEASRLLSELYRKKTTYRYALLSEFMLLNGCRIGEATALQHKHFNSEEKTIDIHGTLSRYEDNPTSTKTYASYRTVPLTEREIEILNEIISLNQLEENSNPNWHSSDYIFVGIRGNPIQSSVFARALQRANERLESPINKHLSSHIFRHSLVSTLAEHNIPLLTIMNRVGHADSDVTTKIYSHVTKNMKNQAVDILNQISYK